MRAPVRGNYRGYDIVSMPLPSSGGTVLVEILNILEGFPLDDMKQGSADIAARDGRGDEARLCGPRALSRRSRLCRRADHG